MRRDKHWFNPWSNSNTDSNIFKHIQTISFYIFYVTSRYFKHLHFQHFKLFQVTSCFKDSNPGSIVFIRCISPCNARLQSKNTMPSILKWHAPTPWIPQREWPNSKMFNAANKGHMSHISASALGCDTDASWSRPAWDIKRDKAYDSLCFTSRQVC